MITMIMTFFRAEIAITGVFHARSVIKTVLKIRERKGEDKTRPKDDKKENIEV